MSGYEVVMQEVHEKAAHTPPGQLLSDVEAERVTWLWEGRIPLGKLTVLDGDPGNGKSALTTDLAARVSVGRDWPDGAPCEAGGVVLCSAEDGLADTIRPRLDAAGGDPARVLSLAALPDGEGSERPLAIPGDLPELEAGISRVGARLVVIDPIMAYLSGDTNAHKDQDVRRALTPLASVAERTGAAIVVVRHLNKGAGGDALYRGGGSIGIVGAARSALVVAKDPDDEDRRVIAPLKQNLSAPAASLLFELQQADNGAVRVEYTGESAQTAQGLLSAPVDDEERREQSAIRSGVRQLLEEHFEWEGTPQELWDALAGMDCGGLPERPDELSKTLPKLARTGGFEVRRKWSRGEDGKSRRVLKLRPPETDNTRPNGVDGVDGVDGVVTDHPLSTPSDGQKPHRNGNVYADHADNTSHANGSGVVVNCGHGYPGGKGCAACDPEHPHRIERTTRGGTA